ncbi:hypothetical protein ACHAXS_012287, partial [Conticribra weissflogii]
FAAGGRGGRRRPPRIFLERAVDGLLTAVRSSLLAAEEAEDSLEEIISERAVWSLLAAEEAEDGGGRRRPPRIILVRAVDGR